MKTKPLTKRFLTDELARAPAPVFIAYTAVCAFTVYFCMYGFRKPFDAVTYTGLKFLDTSFDLKTVCVTAQIIGYVCSKYLGSWICSESRPGVRAVLLIGFITVAESALVLFAILPAPWKPAAMFLNGLPLGMVWGLVVRYLEGRRSSEILVASLSCSYIMAGAVTRDVGRDLVMKEWGLPEGWMPAVTGALFFVPFAVAVWLLDRVPPPSPADVADRAPRVTMSGSQRWEFVQTFGLGFFTLLVAYFFLTAFRDFRDHYGAELLEALGLSGEKQIFSRIEKWAMLGAIAVMAFLNLFTNHRRALVAVYIVIVFGFTLIGTATLGFQSKMIDGFEWMALTGLGLYVAYVPYGAILFERMMAATRFRGTSVFAIQIADGVGYTGSVLVQLYRDYFHSHMDRLAFFVPYSYVVSVTGVVLMAVSGLLVLRRTGRSD